MRKTADQSLCFSTCICSDVQTNKCSTHFKRSTHFIWINYVLHSPCESSDRVKKQCAKGPRIGWPDDSVAGEIIKVRGLYMKVKR